MVLNDRREPLSQFTSRAAILQDCVRFRRRCLSPVHQSKREILPSGALEQDGKHVGLVRRAARSNHASEVLEGRKRCVVGDLPVARSGAAHPLLQAKGREAPVLCNHGRSCTAFLRDPKSQLAPAFGSAARSRQPPRPQAALALSARHDLPRCAVVAMRRSARARNSR